jgi:hypothetical protein
MVKFLPFGPTALSIPAEQAVVNCAVLPRELLKSRGECRFLFLPECGDFLHTLPLLQCHTKKRSVVLDTRGFNNFVALPADVFNTLMS